jgi:hypothetical protein
MTITIPTLLFGAVLATLYGTIFHLWRGGGAGRLLLYLILSWLGFWLGHFLADYLGLNFFKIGSLQVLFASVGSILFMLLGYWLSPVKVENK